MLNDETTILFDPTIPLELVKLRETLDATLSSPRSEDEEPPTIVGRWLVARDAWLATVTPWRAQHTLDAWLDMLLAASEFLACAALWDGKIPFKGRINRHFKYTECLDLTCKDWYQLGEPQVEEAALWLYRARVQQVGPPLTHQEECNIIENGLHRKGIFPR